MSPLGSVPYASDSGGLFTAVSVSGDISTGALTGTVNQGTVPQVISVAILTLSGAFTRRSNKVGAGSMGMGAGLATLKLRALIAAAGSVALSAVAGTRAAKALAGMVTPLTTLVRRRLRRALRFLGKAGIVSRG